MVGTARGQNVEFIQTSDPAGIVDSRSFPALSNAVTTVAAPYTSGGFRFCYWTINGTRSNDLVGRALNPVTFVADAPIAAVAHYLPENQDSNGSGLPDAFKLEYFGTLDITLNSMPVADGFTVGQKLQWGWNPATFNQIETGGISRRRGDYLVVVPGYVGPREHLGGISRRRSALATVVLNSAYARLNVVSDPAGIVSSRQVVAKGSPVNLPVAPESSYGYRFTGWLTNGVRVDAPWQWQPIPITISDDTTVVARYIPEAADTLGVGIADWMEWYYFNGIGYTLDSDPVGDGIPLGMKIFRGYSLTTPHELAVGGVSRRRAALATVIVSSNYVRLNETSDPAGLVSSSRVVARGATVNLSVAPQSAYGYRFTGWLTNGARVDAPTQYQPIPMRVDQDATVTARYILESADTLGVGIPDWMEWFYFNRIGYTLDADPVGDGLTLGLKLFRGYSLSAPHELALGGISRRRSALTPVNFFRVAPPGALSGAADPIHSTMVTLNGVVSPNSLPTTAHFEYGLTSAYGNSTEGQNAGMGTNDTSFLQSIGGLTLGTTYHFRLVTASKSGVTYGDDQTFATLPVLDTVMGQVELEAYVGMGGGGIGNRIVTFTATDGGNGILERWSLPLGFVGGVASYSLTNVPSSVAHLSAKTAWSLRRRLPVTLSTEATLANFSGSSLLAGGDLDGSNTVDIGDYYKLASSWYLPNTDADVNGSGLVDLDDYFLLSHHWQEAGDSE